MVSYADLGEERAHELLSALAAQLALEGVSYDEVVVGGLALIALGFVSRTTRDVDVVALREGAGLVPADPLPEALVRARDRVARDFGVDPEWLNARASDIARFGFPDGFESRVVTRSYGDALTVRLASRLDLIHFKLTALVDRGAGGRHDEDLKALAPTQDELLAAARWAMTHDPSEGFRETLERALAYLGVEDADLDA